MIRTVARRALGRSRPEGESEEAPPVPAPARPTRPGSAPRRPVDGLVEEFSSLLVTGWVSVPASAPATRVDLYLGGVKVASTYATPDAPMSGVGSATRGGDPAVTGSKQTGGLVHSWQVAPVRGPADDRRNHPDSKQIRTFSFRVREIWDYVSRSTRVKVKVGEQLLPIQGHGMFLTPPKRGRRSLHELRTKLEEGYLLSQYGRIQLSKQLDTDWQQQVMALYDRTRRVLRETTGHEAFFIYGTLLGAVREGGYIGHDIDFDAAYLSEHTTGHEAAAQLAEVALALVADGLSVECHLTALHISDPSRSKERIDLFHTWFDADGELQLPFGIAGTSTVTSATWQGTREIEFPGGRGLVPVNAEELVEHLYGADWRQPKPGFNWDIDRTRAADDGRVPVELQTKVYWADFYARTEYTTGSTFFEYVDQREDTPATIIDIGCGDGRDACAFGASGRTVLGLDQSPVGIEHASRRAASPALKGRVSFQACDVADAAALGHALDTGVDATGGAVMFYLRFFLHAIDEQVQAALLDAIGTHARPGDMFAAEFRTDRDASTKKVHTKHYRRFQSSEALVDDLTRRGWEVLHHEEGAGLSPYGDEDPILARIIARV